MQQRRSAAEVSITLRGVPISVSELRRALPKLTAELREKYPTIRDVRIEEPEPLRHRKDRAYYAEGRYAATFALSAAHVLVITLGYGILSGVGSEIGKTATQKIKKYVQQWLRKLSKPKRKRKKA